MDKYKSTTKLSPLQEKKSQSIDWAAIIGVRLASLQKWGIFLNFNLFNLPRCL